MADPILPRDLPAAPSVPSNAAIIVDNGVNVQKATPAQIADTARPLASQAEAETGTDNAKTMTPLRTAQAIDNRNYDGLIDGKEPAIDAGTTAQYYRGDKSWQTLNKAAVGLGNVDNTADADKPVSTAQQTALDDKVTATAIGISGSATDMGPGGDILTDNADARTWFGELETAIIETPGTAFNKSNATAIGIDPTADDMGTPTAEVLPNNGTAKDWFEALGDIAGSRSPWTYASRAEAEGANVPAPVKQIGVISGNRVLNYVRDASGTALTTGDGATWSPADLVVTPEHFGAVGDGSDETTKIHAAALFASTSRRTLMFGGKTYGFDNFEVRNCYARWRSEDGRTILKSLKSAPDTASSLSEFAINFDGDTIRSETLANAITAGNAQVTLGSTADIVPGETLLVFNSTRMIETDNRGQKRHGFSCAVARIVSGTVVELEKAVPVNIAATNITGVAVTAVGSDTCAVSGLSSYGKVDVLYRLRFNTVGGVASTATALPLSFDPATQTFTFHSNSPRPSGLAIGDSITVERVLSVVISNPSFVDIGDGITLEREPHLTATPGDAGFRGFMIQRANKALVKGVETRWFSENGIVLVDSYAPDLSDIRCVGSNRAYNGSDGTGSGISCFQTSWGVFRDIHGSGCRRTLDFSGTQGSSYYNIAENISGEGGGTAYDGVRFWPMGLTEQSVVGSHGGGFFTRYINSRGSNVVAVINLRGCDEVVRGVYGAGKIDRMVNSFYGDGADIDGVFYSAGNAEWASGPKYVNSTSAGGRLNMVLRIDAASILSTKLHSLRNVTARGVKSALVGIVGSGSVGPIDVSGNISILTDDVDGDEANFYALRQMSGGPATFAGPVRLGAMSILNSPEAPKALIGMATTSFVFASGAYLKLPNGAVQVQMADDTAIKFPVYVQGTTARLSLRCVSRDRTTPYLHINDAEIWANRTTDRAAVPNGANVDVLASALTGTTGADGKVSVAFRPGDDGFLHVENRYGSSQFFFVECDMLT